MTKFVPTGEAVQELVGKLKTEKKREETYTLIELHKKISKFEPVIWYPGIIGFGKKIYKTKSGIEGEIPILAFAPRQSKFSLYLGTYFPEKKEYLDRLGKCKLGVGCVYVNKLEDIDLTVLEEILKKIIEKE